MTLTDGSRIEASTLGSGLGGTLQVNASELLELSGTLAEDSQTPTALAAFVYPYRSEKPGQGATRAQRLDIPSEQCGCGKR